jgi:transposase
MEPAVTIGLDLAKSVFQVHGVSASGEVVIRRKFARAKVLDFFAKLPRCLVGMDLCGLPLLGPGDREPLC